LTLYCGGALTIKSGARAIVDGPNLSRLSFVNLGTQDVTFQDNSSAQGVVLSPQGRLHLGAGFQFYGAAVADRLSMQSSADFHQDTNITSGNDPVVLGGDGVVTPDAWGRVVQ
jgi:hypothetical protein